MLKISNIHRQKSLLEQITINSDDDAKLLDEQAQDDLKKEIEIIMYQHGYTCDIEEVME